MSDKTDPPLYIAPVLDLSNGSKRVPSEMEIGQRIKELRTKLGISVEALAALTEKYDYDTPSESSKGVSIPTLYRYEKGERLPGAREIRLLCDALQTTPNWLILGRHSDSRAMADAEIASLARRLFSLLGEHQAIENSGQWSSIEHTMKLQEAKAEADKKL